MWKRIDLDTLSGRVRAVSAPDERQVLAVVTDTGLFGVWFSRSATVLRMGSVADAERATDPQTGVLRRQDTTFRMAGDIGSQRFTPQLLQFTPHGDVLHFTPDVVSVRSADGSTLLELDRPRSDRWLAAGFSPDGRYLLLADEREVWLFRHTPKKGAHKPAWAAKGPVSEQQALLAAVTAAADDDLPRLVYADWLQENGDPARGDLIRLQCEHAHAVRAGRLYPGEGEVMKLLQAHGDRWAAEYPVVRGVKWSGFWRGFPCATAFGGTLARTAAKVWTAAPVESVVLTRLTAADIVSLMNCAFLDRLRILDVRGFVVADPEAPPAAPVVARAARQAARWVPPSTFFHFLNCLRNVWWLAFSGNSSLGLAGCRAIAQSYGMPNLEVLGLRWCQVGDEAAEELLAPDALSKLRDLDLRGNTFGDTVPPRLRKRFPNVIF